METYFESFHEDEKITENSFLPTVDEVMKDQLGVLESIKKDEKIASEEEHMKNQYSIGKEDFHQIMTDWQQHIGLLQPIDTEDVEFGLGLGDALNTYSSSGLFEEKDNLILSKALTCPVQSSIVNDEPTPKFLSNDSTKDLVIENLNSCNVHFENNQKLCGLMKTESNLIGKVKLLNGEKEILGKNIIGLHCLNEIKENPHENCQVASTVINGKRYKIIIKPKSLKVKKLTNEKIKKTLIKKLLQCNLVTKAEPKEDEIISEMRNGNYDVPILGSDLLPSWELINLDSGWNMELENDTNSVINESETESAKKVSPLKIKVRKCKKSKKKSLVQKSDEEVDVETVSDKVVEGSNLGNLLKNFEDEVAKLQGEKSLMKNSEEVKNSGKKVDKISENIKSSLPKEMIERIEALKHKKDSRIPLIQAIPSKKAGKCSTRMQDAVATMNRNKLLKIVSGGDTISLDHDYCSITNKKMIPNKQIKKLSHLTEKNPKKDSGMESGDVSDTSEGANTPESLQNAEASNICKRLMQINQVDGREAKNDLNSPAKSKNTDFRDSNTFTIKGDVCNSDFVKTETVSNGNKALTNNHSNSDSNSDSSSVTVPSDTKNKSEDDQENNRDENETHNQKDKNACSSEKSEFAQSLLIQERPKRKLKLEEYLNRRNIREKEKQNLGKESTVASNDKMISDVNLVPPSQSSKTDLVEVDGSKNNLEKVEANEKFAETSSTLAEKKEKKSRRERVRSSSSTSSGDRRECRKQSRSRSRSYWRSSSSSSSSNPKRHEKRGKHRSRWSSSRERRRDSSSGSSSRSSSRESSTSSDYFSNKRRNSSRYQRRSRSRCSYEGRSRSPVGRISRRDSNRSHLGNYYYYKENSKKRRPRSPYYGYSMREKQRQIEERRVIYVGRIEEGMTSTKLRKRFSAFGPIIDISLHFREYGDNYGFMTYAYKADAYDAVEHGNDDPTLPHYDLCFGGRRGFCKEKYADLDGMPTSYSGLNDTLEFRRGGESDSFDLLLKEAQAKLKSRKKQLNV